MYSKQFDFREIKTLNRSHRKKKHVHLYPQNCLPLSCKTQKRREDWSTIDKDDICLFFYFRPQGW